MNGKALLIIGTVLFIVAAVVSTGTDLAGVKAETFALLGLAAWCLSGAA